MTERQLFAGDLVEIHDFACAPGDRAWREVNVIESVAPIVVFPRAIVGIHQHGRAPIVATPNVAVVYRPGQSYDRELRDPRGDRCTYVVVRERETATPCAVHVDASTFLRHRALVARLDDPSVDPLFVEESAAALLDDVLGAPPVRAGRIADDAVELLTATVTEQLTLADLGARLAVSPFHLARVFRAHTGFTLHGFRTQLRLRLAFDRLPECRGELTRLALELGFASHSHFTDAFRRGFGVPPRTIAEAGSALPS